MGNERGDALRADGRQRKRQLLDIARQTKESIAKDGVVELAEELTEDEEPQRGQPSNLEEAAVVVSRWISRRVPLRKHR